MICKQFLNAYILIFYPSLQEFHLKVSYLSLSRYLQQTSIIMICFLFSSYFLERSHSARVTLSKAYELCPDEVRIIPFKISLGEGSANFQVT